MESQVTIPEGKDIYDIEMERLNSVEDPDDFKRASELAWMYGNDHAHLFDACGPNREIPAHAAGEVPGCITQVKDLMRPAATPELTAEIRADNRLPDKRGPVSREYLPLFAEYQRRFDKLFNRPVPTTTQVKEKPNLAHDMSWRTTY